MEKIFKEMMENYCRMYLHSEEGQKTMLLSMASMLNQRNLETSNSRLSNSNVGYKWILRDTKYASEKIQEIIDLRNDITSENCKILCNVVVEITRILDAYKTKPIADENAEKNISIIYEDMTLFGVEKRRISREEFLEIAEADEEQQEIYDSPYFPPERRDESRLVKYGYSVSQNSRLSNAERQDLLRRIIASKEVSKGYVISYLKHNIAINGKKKSNYIALQKWESDLEYVLKL